MHLFIPFLSEYLPKVILRKYLGKLFLCQPFKIQVRSLVLVNCMVPGTVMLRT